MLQPNQRDGMFTRSVYDYGSSSWWQFTGKQVLSKRKSHMCGIQWPEANVASADFMLESKGQINDVSTRRGTQG